MSLKTFIANDKIRRDNAKATIISAITGKGATSNTKNNTVNTVLSKVASNPFATAGIIAGIKSPVTGQAFSKGQIGKTTIGLVAVPVVTSAVVSNPQATAKGIKEASGFSQDLTNFSGNLASVKNFDDIYKVAKENPVLTGGLVLVGGFLVKGGTNVVSNIINTQSVKDNTDALREGNKLVEESLKNKDNFTTTPPPATDPTTKKDGGLVTTPPPNYADQNMNKSNSTQTGAPVSTQPSSGAPVNIQQNNYFGDKLSEKYINSKKNTN